MWQRNGGREYDDTHTGTVRIRAVEIQHLFALHPTHVGRVSRLSDDFSQRRGDIVPPLIFPTVRIIDHLSLVIVSF